MASQAPQGNCAITPDTNGHVDIPQGSTAIGKPYSTWPPNSDEAPFWQCDPLRSVTIPDTVEFIAEAAFQNTAITSITIPDSVTHIGQWGFAGTWLTSVTLPDSLTIIETYTFGDAESLTTVTLPDSLTSIKWGAFLNNPLTDVCASSAVADLYTDPGWGTSVTVSTCAPTVASGICGPGTTFVDGTCSVATDVCSDGTTLDASIGICVLDCSSQRRLQE